MSVKSELKEKKNELGDLGQEDDMVSIEEMQSKGTKLAYLAAKGVVSPENPHIQKYVRESKILTLDTVSYSSIEGLNLGFLLDAAHKNFTKVMDKALADIKIKDFTEVLNYTPIYHKLRIMKEINDAFISFKGLLEIHKGGTDKYKAHHLMADSSNIRKEFKIFFQDLTSMIDKLTLTSMINKLTEKASNKKDQAQTHKLLEKLSTRIELFRKSGLLDFALNPSSTEAKAFFTAYAALVDTVRPKISSQSNSVVNTYNKHEPLEVKTVYAFAKNVVEPAPIIQAPVDKKGFETPKTLPSCTFFAERRKSEPSTPIPMSEPTPKDDAPSSGKDDLPPLPSLTSAPTPSGHDD